MLCSVDPWSFKANETTGMFSMAWILSSRSLTRSFIDGVGAGDGFSANKIPGANKQAINLAIDRENKRGFILGRSTSR